MSISAKFARVPLVVLVVLFLGGASALFAPSADAASTYDGKYSYETKCENDKRAVLTQKTIPSTKGSATIRLMYSKVCRTVWVVLEYNAPFPVTKSKLKAWVHRNSDGKEYMASSPWDQGWDFVGRQSRMLYDANVSSYAAGRYGSGAIVRTGSY